MDVETVPHCSFYALIHFHYSYSLLKKIVTKYQLHFSVIWLFPPKVNVFSSLLVFLSVSNIMENAWTDFDDNILGI